MKYELNSIVLYEQKIKVKVWDYSLRYNTYTLKAVENENATYEDIPEDDITPYENYEMADEARYLASTFKNATRFRMGYGEPRNVGETMIQLYDKSYLTEPKFYTYFIRELEKLEAENLLTKK